jgi:hypothetical protein
MMRLSWLLVLTPLVLAACGSDPEVIVTPQAASAPPSTVVVPQQAPADRTVVVPSR